MAFADGEPLRDGRYLFGRLTGTCRHNLGRSVQQFASGQVTGCLSGQMSQQFGLQLVEVGVGAEAGQFTGQTAAGLAPQVAERHDPGDDLADRHAQQRAGAAGPQLTPPPA